MWCKKVKRLTQTGASRFSYVLFHRPGGALRREQPYPLRFEPCLLLPVIPPQKYVSAAAYRNIVQTGAVRFSRERDGIQPARGDVKREQRVDVPLIRRFVQPEKLRRGSSRRIFAAGTARRGDIEVVRRGITLIIRRGAADRAVFSVLPFKKDRVRLIIDIQPAPVPAENGEILRAGVIRQTVPLLYHIRNAVPSVKLPRLEQLDVKADEITEDSSIQDDLGADSLDVVDLVMAIEDEFSVEIPEDQVENIKTVGDIVKFIEDNAEK